MARLWQLAVALPVESVPLTSFAAMLDERGDLSNRELAREAVRIMQADLSYPIIFSAQGWLFDGAHRVMKAYALGLTEINAVRFVEDPEPDYRRQVTTQESAAEISSQGMCDTESSVHP